jgi:hypothetical protein
VCQQQSQKIVVSVFAAAVQAAVQQQLVMLESTCTLLAVAASLVA